MIYTVWHGRILMLPYLYGRSRRIHALTSRSRDGEILSRFVQGFGIRVVRGSSSRGGARALRTLARLLREERAEVLVVPDGPRGPRHVAQAGAVLLAKVTGTPMVPVAFGATPCTVLPSWDAFLIPHPFARAVVMFGEPITVPADAGRDLVESKRRELEAALLQVTDCGGSGGRRGRCTGSIASSWPSSHWGTCRRFSSAKCGALATRWRSASVWASFGSRRRPCPAGASGSTRCPWER